MLFFKIAHNPLNEVVFEHTLDELVKQIWGDEAIDVCMGKVLSERLEGESDYGALGRQTDDLQSHH